MQGSGEGTPGSSACWDLCFYLQLRTSGPARGPGAKAASPQRSCDGQKPLETGRRTAQPEHRDQRVTIRKARRERDQRQATRPVHIESWGGGGLAVLCLWDRKMSREPKARHYRLPRRRTCRAVSQGESRGLCRGERAFEGGGGLRALGRLVGGSMDGPCKAHG